MSLIKKGEIDFSFVDKRGFLFQVVHNGYRQINILFSKRDVVRGGHYHKKCNEAFFVISGSVNVTACLNDEKEEKMFKKGDFFIISKEIVHSMKFPEDCLMLQMYDIPVTDELGQKDIISSEV